MNAAIILKLLDGAFLLLEAGLNRQAIVDKVKAELDAGATPEQIADMLRDGRLASEAELAAELEKKPPAPK